MLKREAHDLAAGPGLLSARFPLALQELSGHLAARFLGQVLTTGQELTFEYQVGAACLAPAALLRPTCCRACDSISSAFCPCWARQGWIWELLAMLWARATHSVKTIVTVCLACRSALRLPGAVVPVLCILCAQCVPCTPPPPTPPSLQGVNYLLRVNGVMVADPTAEQLSVHRGMLMADSAYVFETRHGGGLKVTGQRSVVTTQLFKHKVGGRLKGCGLGSTRLGF